MKIDQVLNKSTLAPSGGKNWHIVLEGHPEDLLDALEVVANTEGHVIQTAEWLARDELLICLRWIEPGIARWVQSDIKNVSNEIKVKLNGEAECHGHNMEA